MTISRIYQPVSLKSGEVVALEEQASHHLARVLRAETGDVLTLFNGEGGEYEAKILEIKKKQVIVAVGEFVSREAESPVNICLAQGIARGEKMDFIVQKAVELGVASIVPLITERCNVRLDAAREEKRLQHWRSVVISACEQSGRNRLPVIQAPVELKKWLPQTKADMRFVLSPHVIEKLPETAVNAQKSIIVLIGPEGGLSDEEVALAVSHGFAPLNLGARVLRTETASLAALSVLQYVYGDLR